MSVAVDGAASEEGDAVGDAGEWLTLSEVASRLHWHLRRVQSRARREEWPKRRSNQGTAMEYRVPTSLLAAPMASPDAGTDDAMTELYTKMADLREELGAAKGELAAELRRSHDYAERIADLRAALDQARAELTEARKPFLLRLLEALRRR